MDEGTTALRLRIATQRSRVWQLADEYELIVARSEARLITDLGAVMDEKKLGPNESARKRMLLLHTASDPAVKEAYDKLARAKLDLAIDEAHLAAYLDHLKDRDIRSREANMPAHNGVFQPL